MSLEKEQKGISKLIEFRAKIVKRSSMFSCEYGVIK